MQYINWIQGMSHTSGIIDPHLNIDQSSFVDFKINSKRDNLKSPSITTSYYIIRQTLNVVFLITLYFDH